jgi:translation initiation factor IF-1
MPKGNENAERQVEATVLRSLPQELFCVELEGRLQVTAHLGAKSRSEFLRLLPGDRVKVVLSPRDPGRGRIVERCKA